MTSYPIDSILPKLKEAVLANPSLVLHAPPGAGKTTRVPLALLDILPPAQGRIIMLEPRRIAAVSAARWMAKTLGEQAGDTVGYAIRFDAKRSDRTRIEVVTEGILTRRIQSDPGLEGVAMVIFDEFHERSIHADLALALCLDIRRQLRPDLKLLVMSATMECGPIAALLGNAPVITSTGKAFPVEEQYLADTSGSLAQRITSAVKIALKDTHGDILVFLPGSGEIRACERQLREALNMSEDRVALHPLYGDLPFEEQERAILPSKDQRKIVLATNIAETSLTIEGVHVVIDGGLTRMLRYDPATGMNRLVTVPASKASAEQRKGRAGRLGPGVCYRLYSKHDLHGMPAFTQPEILLSDLSPLALELAAWGVKDPHALSWLDAPPAAAWATGVQLLKDLGALDAAGSITSPGRAMARLPLHPRLSRLMIRSQELGCVDLGADLAAILSEREIFRHSATDRMINEPDISERVDALRRGRTGTGAGRTTDSSALRAAERTSQQLRRLMSGTTSGAAEKNIDHDAIARLLLSAYPDRICKRRATGNCSYVITQGRGVRLSPDSHLVSSQYLIAVNVDAGEKTEGIIHLAAPVTEDLIRSECGGRIETFRKVEWNRQENRIAAAEEERLGELIISARPFTPADEEAAPILCDVVRATPGLLTFSKEATRLQARTGLMKKAFPEETWPDLSEEHLFIDPKEWLLPWLGNIRSAQGLRGLNVLSALKARLSREQGRLLDERAPLSITAPSGSRVALDYSSGAQPILAVKLQEMFGLADTPTIASGRVTVLLHLLSPARRPVQITQDLRGFWNTTYPLVKKDLKGRYPRHPWPDDPWNAAPTKRTKPRGT
ncbi:MAG: ATP-dependent helicase HrpB [Nitrospirae bacterium]|nr:ATP-dependent helicase HrpB [Nitrospirota bacterium]